MLSVNRMVFTVFDIGLYAFITATVASSVVMLAETLPIADRARGAELGRPGRRLRIGSIGLCCPASGLGGARRWS
jgi:hypothetical protein